MKTILVFSLLTAFAMGGEKHEFTSADGSKKMTAEVMRYDSKKREVSLKVGDQKIVKLPATSLSPADVEYVIKTAKEQAYARDLEIKIKPTSETTERKNDGTYATSNTPRGYAVTFSNASDTDLEKVELQYSYFYSKNDGSGRQTEKILTDIVSSPELTARGKTEVATKTVTLLNDMKSVSSCPLCQTNASKHKRESLEGIQVKVMKSGQLLTELYYPATAAKKFAKSSQSASGN